MSDEYEWGAPPPPPPPPPPPEADAAVAAPPDPAEVAAEPESSDPVPRRLPVVLLLLVFVAAAVLVERGADGAAPPAVAAEARTSVSAAADDDGDAVWFCAAGTATGSAEAPAGEPPAAPADVVAEHQLLITNAAEDPRTIHVTAYPSVEAVPAGGQPSQSSTPAPEPVTRDFEVPAGSRLDLDVAELMPGRERAPFVSAMVEVDGSRVAVAHHLRGPTGESTAPCSSTASRSWYFAAGSTKGNTRQLLVLFNPFPQQVVADVVFQAEDGDRQALRAPQRLEGVVVPPRQTLALDVTDDVADRRQVSTKVEAKDPTSRLVVDRLLLNRGGPFEIPFLSVGPGAAEAHSGWVFSEGRPLRADVTTTFVLYNPSGDPVDVEMRVRSDRVGSSEPFRVTVRTGEYQEIPLESDRVGADAGYWAVLVARSGGTFVVERMVQAKAMAPPAPPPGVPAPSASVAYAGGVTYTMGTPVLGSEWIVPAASVDGGGAGQVAILNAGDAVVTLHVETLVDGQVTGVKDFHGVTLDPGLRTTVDLADPSLAGGAPGARRAVRVRADGPLVVETTLAAPSTGDLLAPRGISDWPAVPVREGLTLPFADLLSRASPDADAEPTVEPSPEGNEAPDTAPPTSR